MFFDGERKNSMVPYHVGKHVGLLSIDISGAVAAEVNTLLVVFVCLQRYVSGAFLVTTGSLRCVSEIGCLSFTLVLSLFPLGTGQIIHQIRVHTTKH